MIEGRKLFNKGDVWLMIGLLVFSASAYGIDTLLNQRNGAVVCRIIQEGKRIESLTLEKDRTFSIPESPPIVFEIKESGICFQSSDCPDKTCVRSGYIKHPGQSLVCLPNRVIIRLEASDGRMPQDDIDTIIGGLDGSSVHMDIETFHPIRKGTSW